MHRLLPSLTLVALFFSLVLSQQVFGQVPGSISGTVTKSGTRIGLDNVSVEVYTASSGTLVDSALTNGTGVYSVSDLPPGDYHVRTRTRSHYIDETYDDQSCPGGQCTGVTPTPVTVNPASNTAGINFALVEGGSISGTVVDANGGSVSIGLEVKIYNALDDYVASGYTLDLHGNYLVSQLPAGLYHAHTLSPIENWYDELYDNIPCPGGACDVGTGTGISVTAGADTANINFAIWLKGSISGTVTEDATGEPIEGVEVKVFLKEVASDDERLWGSALTDATGAYRVLLLLDTTWPFPDYYYRVETLNTSGYVDEVFDDRWCVVGDCPADEDNVEVIRGADTPGIDFALDWGGQISGTVVSQVTGGPIASAQVEIDNSGRPSIPGGYPTVIVTTDASGDYISPALPPGTYTVRTIDQYLAGFIDEIFNDIPCDSTLCDRSTGAPITVEAESVTTNIDFALDRQYFIGGTVTGLLGDAVVLQNNAGDDLVIDADGEFTFATPMDSGSSYEVTIFTHPFRPSQDCEVSNGTGIVSAADIQDVTVSCGLSCKVNTVSGRTEESSVSHEACEILVVGPAFTAKIGASVTLSSGWEIDFMPGFLVETGASLEASVCGQSLCEVGALPMPYGCHSCVDKICDDDDFCCNNEFDLNCVNQVESVCGLTCE